MGVAEHNGVRSNFNKSSGKWYWEITIDSGTTHFVGVATALAGLDSFAGGDEHAYSYHDLDGKKYTNSAGSTYGDTYEAGDVIGVALDLDNNEVFFSKNGVWQDSGDPAAGTDPAYSITDGTYYAIWSGYDGGEVTANFGASAFVYDAPTGFAHFGSGGITITWDEDYVTSTTTLLSNGNLTAEARPYGYEQSIIATEGKLEGKWYWEIIYHYSKTPSTATAPSNVPPGFHLGISNSTLPIAGVFLGDTSDGYAFSYTGELKNNGSSQSFGSAMADGDVIGIALDLDEKKLWFSVNGVWQDSGDPSAGTDHAFSNIPSQEFFPAATVSRASYICGQTAFGHNLYGFEKWSCTANFGDSTFSYDIPTGFLPYNSVATIEEPVLAETTTTADTISVNVEYGQSETVHEATLSEGMTTADSNFAELPGESEDLQSGTQAESFTTSAEIIGETPNVGFTESITLADVIEGDSPYQNLGEDVTITDVLSSADSVMNTTNAENIEISDEIIGGFLIEDTEAEDVTTSEAISVERELAVQYLSEGMSTADSISATKEKSESLTETSQIYDTLELTWILTSADGGSTAEITDTVKAELGLNVSEWIEVNETLVNNWTGTEPVNDTVEASEKLIFGWLKSLTSTVEFADVLTVETLWEIIDYLNASDVVSETWTGVESITSLIDLRDAITLVWPLLAESTAVITDTSVLETIYKIQEFLKISDESLSQWTGTESVTSTLDLFGQAMVAKLFDESVTSTVAAVEVVAYLHQMISIAESTFASTDSVSTQINFNPTITESIAVTGLLSIIQTLNLSISESGEIVDSLGFAWMDTLSETFSIVDTTNLQKTAMILLTESLAATEAAVGLFNFTDTITETLQAVAAITLQQVLTETVNETINFGITILLDGELWETWVLSGNKFDMSVYSGFEFNSYAVYGNQAFGCKSDGIYKLSGSTDNGTAFKSGLVLPETNFGIANKKRFRRAYFGLSGSSPAIKIESETGDVTYNITNSQANLQRGQKGVDWTLKVSDWTSLEFIELIPIILTR